MTLQNLAWQLNGTVNCPWINVSGPGHGAGDRSLGILFDPKAPDGFRVHSFAGDDEDACRGYVKSLLQEVDGDLCDPCKPEHHPNEGIAPRIQRARALWQRGTSLTATPGESYFNGRGCPVPGDDVIRFLQDCPFGTLRVPTVLALITDAVTGEPIGVHRTAIKDDGSGKRFGADSKRILGVARRGAVRLHVASEHFAIAEGVESALSATQVFGVAVWATLSSGGIARFPVLPGIKKLTVFADHDQPGIAAAATCSRRYNAAGIDAEIRHPSRPGTDWNDYLTRESK